MSRRHANSGHPPPVEGWLRHVERRGRRSERRGGMVALLASAVFGLSLAALLAAVLTYGAYGH
jgi:hypothetical protein